LTFRKELFFIKTEVWKLPRKEKDTVVIDLPVICPHELVGAMYRANPTKAEEMFGSREAIAQWWHHWRTKLLQLMMLLLLFVVTYTCYDSAYLSGVLCKRHGRPLIHAQARQCRSGFMVMKFGTALLVTNFWQYHSTSSCNLRHHHFQLTLVSYPVFLDAIA